MSDASALLVTASPHTRTLAFALFENERATKPHSTYVKLWDSVVSIHARHQIRADKSGWMFGAYNLDGTRSDQNVGFRSCIQLDIDGKTIRDKVTGQIVEVSEQAPALGLVRPKIDQFEWLAASSHSHDPASGVIKYRILILPDRDILRGEHHAVLEALDELLGGCLDRGAWPFSQAFYLPSCPASTAQDAFVHHNHGIPLPVDVFAARGRAILSAHAASTTQLGSNTARSFRTSHPESADGVERVKAMLAAIPANLDRSQWRSVVWAVCSLGWTGGETLARDWSKTDPASYDASSFNNVWQSYDPNRVNSIGLGTLEYLAKAHGYTPQLLAPASGQDGKGFDVANGVLFAELWRGKLLHIHETEDWLHFNSSAGWLATAPLEQDRAAKAVLDRLRASAAHQLATGVETEKVGKLLKHIEYTSRASSIHAMIDMAKSEPGLTRRLSEFDSYDMLLGLLNGVLDLRTGSLRPASPGLLVSKRCNVNFDAVAVCPQFDQFMIDIQPDPDIRSYLRRLAGVLLTGDSSVQSFNFFYGVGNNGKSVFVETLAWLLGDYSLKIETEMLMQHRRSPQGPSPDIVALKGRRFVYASETEEGQRLAAARIKELTGGDTLSGRVPYAKAAVTFGPTHKLVIVGNHKPEIGDMSQGMWRRVLLVGFDQTIPEANRDPHLIDKLKREGSGILNWALAGLREWRQDGLAVPASVANATSEYRDEQDVLGDWMTENCTLGATHSTPKAHLYLNYKIWAETNGYMALSQGRLTRKLNERGYQLQPDKRTVRGLSLTLAITQPPI